MPKLTVVFQYPDGASMTEAKAMFNKGNIPNLVDVAEYDAIEAYEEAIGKAVVETAGIMDEMGDGFTRD